jgi:nucleoside-diphosphate-sugar epimerase
VLLTGATGYLGRRVLELLVEAGWRVRCLVRRPAPWIGALGAETVAGDITDRESAAAAADGVGAVVHCAARTGVWGPLSDYMEANVAGTRNMLDAARWAGVGVFVHTSSPSAVYDGRDLKGVNESYRADPPRRFPYAFTKALAEAEALSRASKTLRVTALRPHLVWGPGDTHFLPRLLAMARAGNLRMFKGGPYTVDPTYIDDAARAHLLALDSLRRSGRASGRAMFLGQGAPLDSRDFVNALLAAGGLPPVRASVPPWLGRLAARLAELAWRAAMRSGEPPISYFTALQLTTCHHFDLTLARELIGYVPQVTMEEGMRRLKASLAAGPEAGAGAGDGAGG